jgi:hypothetical protein
MTFSPTGSRSSFSASYDLTDPSTVEANQSRAITPEQRRTLSLWVGFSGLGYGFGLLALLSVVPSAAWLFGPDLVDLVDQWLSGDFDLDAQVARLLFLTGFALAWIWVVLRFMVKLRTFWLVWRDLGARDIRQIDGRVVWSGRAYRPEAIGYGAPRRMRFPAFVKASLPPGDFRFYYLPAGGVILSAEPLREGAAGPLPSLARLGAEPAAPSDLVSVLAAVHGHGVDAFERNRLGQLDPAQARKLRHQAHKELLIGAAWVCVPLAFGYGIDDGSWAVRLFVAGLSLVGLHSFYSAYRHIGEARTGRVDVMEGLVTTEVQNNEGSTSYFYRLDGQRFSVNEPAYHALVDGRRYRAYVTPRTHTLVGIEPL